MTVKSVGQISLERQTAFSNSEIDGKALESRASSKEFNRLKVKLVGHIDNLQHEQSYGVPSRLLDILEYIDSLKKSYKADRKKVNELKSALLAKAHEKIGYILHPYIRTQERRIYHRIDPTYPLTKQQQQQSI